MEAKPTGREAMKPRPSGRGAVTYIGPFDPTSAILTGNVATAFRLARAGLCVFPCDWRPRKGGSAPSKAPLVGWAKEATTDLEQILAWWERWPQALVGLPCGPAGLLVIDCDRHGGPDGVAAFEDLSDGRLPTGPIVETLSGGQHYVFRQPAGRATLGNSTGGLPAGVDVRGAGGYIIAPGSMLEDGRGWREADGSPELADAFEEGAIPEVPGWLVDVLTGRQKPSAPTPAPRPRPEPTPGDEEEMVYISEALDCIPADGREEWFRAGAALHYCGYSWGRGVWDSWSRTSAKFDAKVQDRTWKSYSRGYGGAPVTLGWIVQTARLYGFTGHKYEHRPEYNGPFLGPQPRGDKAPAAPRATIVQDGVTADAETGEIISHQPHAVAPWRHDPSEIGYADAILGRRGLVADIARWILTVSRRPQKNIAVATSLAIVAAAASRQLQTPTFSHINLYIAVIGPTGSGKDVAIEAPRNILSASGNENMMGPDGFQSDVGIYDYLRDHPVCLATMNEFGSQIAAATGKMAPSFLQKMLAALRKFYDGGIMMPPHAVSRRSDPLYNPCLTVIGASTPSQFYSALTGAQAEDGTLNRFLAIVVKGNREKQDPSGSLKEPPPELCERLRALAERPGTLNYGRAKDAPQDVRPDVVPWTDEAKTIWNMFEDEILDRMESDKTLEHFAPRCALNALRVATVLAISEDIADPIIDYDHIEIGKSLVNASLADMIEGYQSHGQESEVGRKIDRLLYAIKEAGGVMSRRDLRRSRHWDFPKTREFDEAIDSLIERGEIEVVSEKTANGGPPKRSYRALKP